MTTALLVMSALAMQLTAETPSPNILQIHRELIRPGQEAAYRAIEEDTARTQVRLGGPHPYVAVEALTGPKEVWFFNGYDSMAHSERVERAYNANGPLTAALRQNSRRKAQLTLNAVSLFAHYRPDMSRGAPWLLGSGRFLVITVAQGDGPIEGTAFRTLDGRRFLITPASTRAEADAIAARSGAGAHVFAVRPEWSFPAKEWVDRDPAFWGRGAR